MEIFIAGGCGDFGRNCFFVSGASHAYIVDCGTSTDGLDRVPDLTEEQIRSAEFLFLTHSHRDHTGAVEYLEEMGFNGSVMMSNQTFRQISHKPKEATILDSTAPELELAQDFSFRWGRSGHCAGAVWYAIRCGGKTAFFSGDYREGDPFYNCDPVRDLQADIAVIDCAYGNETTGKDMRRRVMQKLYELIQEGRSVLLPVPRFGRGLSLAVSLWERYGSSLPIYMDRMLLTEWQLFSRHMYFCRPEVLHIPVSAFPLWTEAQMSSHPGIYFLADAQLSSAESRALTERFPEAAILFTGSAHGYGRAAEFLERGRAEMVRWPVHMSSAEAEDLAEKNSFAQVISFHDPYQKAPRKLYTF